MEILEYAIKWCKAEVVSGKVFLIYGIMILIAAICLRVIGNAPMFKSIFIPLIVVSALHITAGGFMIKEYTSRQKAYTISANANIEAFKKTEHTNIDTFIKSYYPAIRIVNIVGIVIALLLIYALATPIGKSIGIGIIITVLSLLVMDYFSEERSHNYRNFLENKM